MLIKVSKALNAHVHLSSCVSSNVSTNFEILSIQTSNGDLFVCQLIDTTKPNSYVVCKDVSWHRLQEESSSSAGNVLLVGSTTGTWNLYTCTNTPGSDPPVDVKLRYTWDEDSLSQLKYSWISTLDAEEITEGDVNVLAFRRNKAIVCLRNQIVCSVDAYLERSLDTRSIFRISEENEPARCVKLADKFLCALEHDGTTVSLFDIERGIRSVCLQLNNYGIQEALDIFVSFSGNRILVADHDKALHSVKITRDSQVVVKLRKPNLVTAFTKQLRSQTGKTQAPESPSFQKLTVTGQLCQVIVEDSCAFLLLKSRSWDTTLHVINFQTTLEFTEHLRDDRPLLVKPAGRCGPPLIVSKDSLFLPSVGLPEADFVKKLMLHSSGSLAEYLSGLNQWVNVSLDKDILVMGIRNRQLDTIGFFLTQKTNEFCKSWYGPSPKDESLKNWVNILKLIQEAVTDSVSDNTSLHFAEQLLQMGLKTLVDLLAFTVTKSTDDKDETGNTFTEFLIMFRSLLKGGRSESLSSHGNASSAEVEFESEHCQRWKTMDKECVIEDAIEHGCVPLAQWFLSQQHGSDVVPLQLFQEQARPLAHQSLCKGDLTSALQIISNTGLQVDRVVQELFESTNVSCVRTLLAAHLESRNLLLPEDRNDLEYIQLLELLYPCTSFTSARQHALDNRPDVGGGPPLPPMDLFPTSDLVQLPIEDQNLDSFQYGLFSLIWIRQWDRRTRQTVLVPALLKGEVIPDEFRPSKDVVWECLLERGDLQRLQEWVTCFVEQPKGDEQNKTFPFGWPIDTAMVNKITEVATPQHVREFLLNDMAKHGFFCHEELEDIQSLLRRLGSAGVLLNGPHLPIQRKTQGSSLSMRQSDYNHRLVHYCLNNHLPNLLYYIIRNNGSALQFSDCAWCRVPLVTTAQVFSQWENSPQDPVLCFRAFLNSAQMVYELKDASIPSMCQNTSVPSSLVVAALLYCPQQIRTTFLSSANLKESLERVLEDVPFVRSALACATGQTQQDVNVYNLLLDNCVFDPRRLFGWQSTNAIKTEEAPSELPHFSHEYWVQNYGLSQSLDTSYYLLEGRPNYAYLKFLAKELMEQKTIETHRILDACLDACILALRHYTSFKVGSACIMFLELLGQDSFCLRMHLQVALALHPENSDTPCKPNVKLLESALKDPSHALEAGRALDEICCRRWSQPGGSTSSLPLCVLLVMFCHFYQLNLTLGFLRLIAKSSDWLSLLSFSQALSIPLEQVLDLIREIPDDCLVDHLISALQVCTVQSKAVKPKVTRETKDMRVMLYNRLGVLKIDKSRNVNKRSRRQVEEDQYSLSSDDGSHSDSSSIKETSEIILQPRDLVEQLLAACNSTSPGTALLDASISNRNPHLCLIAASLTETATVYQSFCCWLVSSLGDPYTVLTSELISSVKDWTLDDLHQAIMLMIKQRMFKLLERAFWLFDPYSSLYRLTDFLHSFWVKKEYRASTELLEKFEAIQATSPIGKIGHAEWVVKTCMGMILSSLISSSNAFEQRLFFEVLSQARLNEIFSEVEDISSFGHLYQLLECVPVVDLGSVDLPISGLLDSNLSRVDQAVVNLVTQLQALGRMKEAKRLGQLAEIPASVVVLSQLNEEANVLQTTDIQKRIAFWNYCNDSLLNEDVDQEHVICFFKIWCSKSSSVREKYTMLALGMGWFSEHSGEQEDWEQEMWCSCVDCEIERMKEQETEEPYICKIQQRIYQHWESWDLDPFDQSDSTRKPIKEAVENLTCVLLDQGRMADAWKMAKIHHYCTMDLSALLVCLKLARKTLAPRDIESDFWNSFLENNCTDKIENIRLELGSAINSNDALVLIEKMCLLINHGKKIAQQILNHFKVSMILGCEYVDTAAEGDPLDLLDSVLNSDSPEKYVLAKEVASVHEIPDQQVVDYLYRRITMALTNVHSPLPSLSAFKMRTRSISLSSWPPESTVSFQLLLRLCQDPAQLGNKLLNMVKVEESVSDGSDLPWKVSLLVYSHECFTACMHMEGISKLLRKAHRLTLQLADAQAFPLMVRLLTGIGRYSEMTYIFDLLRENAQFELLLKKGMEELPTLRLALLDYLKKHHVSDREIHSMLALKFKMFREIAEMLQSASDEKIKELSPGSQNVQNQLKIIMQDYEAAAKSYIEAGCLLRAQNCAYQAQLVAVQLNLLSTPDVAWVLSLDQEAAQKFVITHEHFLQAYIVCEAYGLSTSTGNDPWEQALQVQVLERGDWDYLANFKVHLALTDSRIQSLAQRYPLSSSKEMQSRMQRLLSQCRNLTVRYQLAEQLCFNDMCKDLLQSDATGAYLKDTLLGMR